MNVHPLESDYPAVCCCNSLTFVDVLLPQQRSGETVKVHQLDVAIPLQLKSQLKKGGSAQPCISDADADISNTMQFVMLTRKGNKQQVTWRFDSKHKGINLVFYVVRSLETQTAGKNPAVNS